jgi:hypothetical protein
MTFLKFENLESFELDVCDSVVLLNGWQKAFQFFQILAKNGEN